MGYLASIRREGATLLALAGRDPDRPVPTCPGWKVRDIVAHMDEMTRAPLSEAGAVPSEPGLAAAIATLETLNPPNEELRALALEMALHRWDVENASGDPTPIHADLACDGIGEFFEVAVPGLLQHRGMRAGDGQTIHLHRTDGDGEWMITFDELPILSYEHGKGDAAVRGTASDLVLWLWGRIDPPETFGDPSILDHLRAISVH